MSVTTTTTSPDDLKNVYWSVIRNRGVRKYYIEIAESERGRWNVVLDTDEFTLRLPEGAQPDFFDLLELALAKRSSGK